MKHKVTFEFENPEDAEWFFRMAAKQVETPFKRLAGASLGIFIDSARKAYRVNASIGGKTEQTTTNLESVILHALRLFGPMTEKQIHDKLVLYQEYAKLSLDDLQPVIMGLLELGRVKPATGFGEKAYKL